MQPARVGSARNPGLSKLCRIAWVHSVSPFVFQLLTYFGKFKFKELVSQLGRVQPDLAILSKARFDIRVCFGTELCSLQESGIVWKQFHRHLLYLSYLINLSTYVGTYLNNIMSLLTTEPFPIAIFSTIGIETLNTSSKPCTSDTITI